MLIEELISKYEMRNQVIDRLTDEFDHQLRLAKKEMPNNVNTIQIADMKASIDRLTQEWSLNNKFIEDLKKLKTN
jgi:6-pyruvoyl-tetrahydropterin synthase